MGLPAHKFGRYRAHAVACARRAVLRPFTRPIARIIARPLCAPRLPHFAGYLAVCSPSRETVRHAQWPRGMSRPVQPSRSGSPDTDRVETFRYQAGPADRGLSRSDAREIQRHTDAPRGTWMAGQPVVGDGLARVIWRHDPITLSPVCCGTVCQVPCLACFSSARYPGSCRKRLCLAGGLGGCYSLSEARGGGRGGGGRRAGSRGIGTPPICCTRVEIAVNPFADGFLRITSSMAAIGVALEIHGSILLRRCSGASRMGRSQLRRSLAVIEIRVHGSVVGGHLGP